MKANLTNVIIVVGGWAASHCLWNSKLCCPWGIHYLKLSGNKGLNLTIFFFSHQVLNDKGYDGTSSDVWSCGVILFVLMAGFLPFDDANLMTLYNKVGIICFHFIDDWSRTKLIIAHTHFRFAGLNSIVRHGFHLVQRNWLSVFLTQTLSQ